MIFSKEEKDSWKVPCRSCHALIGEPCRESTSNSIRFTKYMHECRHLDIALLEHDLETIRNNMITNKPREILSAFKDDGIEWLKHRSAYKVVYLHETQQFDRLYYTSGFQARDLYVIFINANDLWTLLKNDNVIATGKRVATVMQIAEIDFIRNWK